MIDFDNVDLDAPVWRWEPQIGDRVRSVRHKGAEAQAAKPWNPQQQAWCDYYANKVVSGTIVALEPRPINPGFVWIVELDEPHQPHGYGPPGPTDTGTTRFWAAADELEPLPG